MATARTVITRALRRAHIVGEGQTPAGEQLAGALNTLNDMLEAWHDEGIPTGLRELEASTELLIDRGALRAITDNLAVELADDAGLQVSQVLFTRAERGRASLVARYLVVKPAKTDRALRQPRRYNVEYG